MNNLFSWLGSFLCMAVLVLLVKDHKLSQAIVNNVCGVRALIVLNTCPLFSVESWVKHPHFEIWCY